MFEPKKEQVSVEINGKKFDLEFDYSMLKKLCHQKPERSFFLFGKQFPLCARCTGIYISFLISFIYLIFNLYLIENIRFIIVLLITFVTISPMLIDGFTQLFKIRESNNILRLITGLLAGFGFAFFLVYLISLVKFKYLV